MILNNLVALCGAYLVGSIPVGYLIARWCGVADLRQHGSGTIGATNVARVLGKQFFIVIFLLDAGKAAGYLLLMQFLRQQEYVVLFAALFLVIGNIFSCFLRGNGGKGVATAVGIFAVLQPLMIPCVVVPFLMVLVVTHAVGVASVVGLCALPFCVYCMSSASVTLLALAISFLALYAHRAHVLRLISR